MTDQNPIEMIFVEKTDREHWGLPVVIVDDTEYAVADNDEQAQKAAIEAARDSLWAFQSSYIASELGLLVRHAEAIAKMQEKLCEDAQPIIELLLGDKADAFLAGAVDTDGRGHFLSPYDSGERDGEDVTPALEGKLLYRLD